MSGPQDPASRLKQRLAALPARIRAETAGALGRIGEQAVAEARRLLSSGPAPSAPGEPPRDPRGDLAEGLRADLDAAAASVTIAAASPQALFLEYGTRTMAARPFLRPAAEAVRPLALEACRQALAAAAKDQGSSSA